MERVRVLIDKLAEQKRNNSTAAQLLVTVQLLQQELVYLQQERQPSGSSKVSVIMPVNGVMNIAAPEEKLLSQPIPAPYREENPAVPTYKPSYTEVPDGAANGEKFRVQQPAETYQPKESPKAEEGHSTRVQPPEHPQFDAMADTPTLSQQPSQKEVHQMLGEQKESLNDRLKKDTAEVAHKLKDSPVKDLKKAIGINDKFVFVNELFRGDEGMYERSIKTINAFHILPEAEYWMNRELKVKLGWNDSKDAVQHFYQLVRRRFS